MVLAFDEDGGLLIFESSAAACQEFEGVDVESGVVSFYDQTGTYLRPHFVTPNRYGKFLGIIHWSVSGEYALVPDPDANEDPIWLALLETSYLRPTDRFSTLEEVKQYLAMQGAIVEKPDEERA